MSKLCGYTHVTAIGNGTFSKVFRAFDPQFKRYVAVKVIPVSQKEHGAKIENETRVLAENGLPCVPHLFDVQKAENRFCW